MSYKTLEVELENGLVTPQGAETLPAKARGLLTILQEDSDSPVSAQDKTDAGFKRFLASPDFERTPEQFRATMEADFFEQ